MSVFWRVVAPNAMSTVRPANFDAADPNAYPGGSWTRYDTIVEFARARGIAVNFNVTDPAPLWATGRPPRPDIRMTYNPSAAEFGQFVTAVATRYSGGFAAPIPIEDTGAPGPVGNLPRVSYWSIWNEPNQAGWLTPQLVPGSGGRLVERSPTLYRQLVNTAYAALLATGHAADTILVGETAPEGLTAKGLPKCSAKRGPERLHGVDQAAPLRPPALLRRRCLPPADRDGSGRPGMSDDGRRPGQLPGRQSRPLPGDRVGPPPVFADLRAESQAG